MAVFAGPSQQSDPLGIDSLWFSQVDPQLCQAG
jgi:hypothetical protein